MLASTSIADGGAISYALVAQSCWNACAACEMMHFLQEWVAKEKMPEYK